MGQITGKLMEKCEEVSTDAFEKLTLKCTRHFAAGIVRLISKGTFITRDALPSLHLANKDNFKCRFLLISSIQLTAAVPLILRTFCLRFSVNN